MHKHFCPFFFSSSLIVASQPQVRGGEFQSPVSLGGCGEATGASREQGKQQCGAAQELKPWFFISKDFLGLEMLKVQNDPLWEGEHLPTPPLHGTSW